MSVDRDGRGFGEFPSRKMVCGESHHGGVCAFAQLPLALPGRHGHYTVVAALQQEMNAASTSHICRYIYIYILLLIII